MTRPAGRTSRQHAERPRLLIPVTYGFSVRYLVPTGLLAALADVCTPVVGVGWDDPDLVEELRDQGVEVVRLPEARLDHRYRMFRRRVAMVHHRRLDSPTTRIQRGQLRRKAPNARLAAIAAARRMKDRIAVFRPGGMVAVERVEPGEVRRGTNVAEFRDVIASSEIDALLTLTPYHDQDGLLLWAARELGIPSITSVISFDNPTTRERLLVRSERVLVWNRFNADELLRSYPDLTPERVSVIGAPQFDLHHRPDLVMEESEWRRALGLPVDRPVILYGAGPAPLVPHERRLVRLLDGAIDDGRIDGGPMLLVRRHPTDDPGPWQELGRTLRHGVVAEPWAAGSSPFRGWPTDADIALQMSSLAHSAVHVNVCSSMTLDGAVFDRPQVGPSFIPDGTPAEDRMVRDYYRQEHWQSIARSGGLVTADDGSALVAAVNDGLRHPHRLSAARRRMVEDVLTFVDGKSSARLVDEVGTLIDRCAVGVEPRPPT